MTELSRDANQEIVSRNSAKPLGIHSLFQLFFQPSKFFANGTIYDANLFLIFALFCYSLARTINRIEKQLVQADMGGRQTQANTYASLGLLQSWVNYWGFTLIIALVGMIFLWWLGGWWYGLRLKWSDASRQDGKEIRAVYVYSALVESLPLVILGIIPTFFYANYAESYAADKPWSLFFLIFPFWSLFTSYIGVCCVFPVTVWKARLWFLILPMGLYLSGYALLLLTIF